MLRPWSWITSLLGWIARILLLIVGLLVSVGLLLLRLLLPVTGILRAGLGGVGLGIGLLVGLLGYTAEEVLNSLGSCLHYQLGRG